MKIKELIAALDNISKDNNGKDREALTLVSGLSHLERDFNWLIYWPSTPDIMRGWVDRIKRTIIQIIFEESRRNFDNYKFRYQSKLWFTTLKIIN